jgi:hypothetical protein
MDVTNTDLGIYQLIINYIYFECKCLTKCTFYFQCVDATTITICYSLDNLIHDIIKVMFHFLGQLFLSVFSKPSISFIVRSINLR